MQVGLMQVGLIGTGYAAKLRAETLQTESRASLVAIAGHNLERTQAFSQPYGAVAYASWQELVALPNLDLVIVSTLNQAHGAIVRAALMAGKHVIVEYPLCLEVAEAMDLLALATAQNKLLHVEHIELLGGVHQALKASLPHIGKVFHARYATLKPERPAPQRWSYHSQQFGFPLMGALSRLHRLVDLFGPVATVTCKAQFWEDQDGHTQPTQDLPQAYYTTCLCTAHLHFHSGVMAEVTYGKGEALWQAVRVFEVQGAHGALVFEGETGTWIQAAGRQPLEVGGRRGLFAKDTAMVLDHLLTGAPLYITPAASVYTLQVAEAAKRSAVALGSPIAVTSMAQ
ncbi:MAG: Gfo/Idh/MocA family oxidoreductase [Leptolyngbyaceae cyanobacterium bins.349]|nr:Gfo/Idh/MocA family oxidoreductase [Leptolyngbyaceae cyanobacterium bins.349]